MNVTLFRNGFVNVAKLRRGHTKVHDVSGVLKRERKMLNFPLWATSLVVENLRLHASNTGDSGSIPGWGTKVPHVTGHAQI